MGIGHVGLSDVRQGGRPSRLRLLAPIRYLAIHHAEKAKYDFIVPCSLTLISWLGYMLMDPRIPLFGDAGLLKYTRDMLVMAVPFLIGALASVAMGAPGGTKLDRRPTGAEIFLDGSPLTLRQFVCYLLGYLSFIGLVTLGLSIFAALLHDPVIAWTKSYPTVRSFTHGFGSLVLAYLLSSLSVTIFWALYFLSDVLNRPER
jgi:hypothetical protein